MTKSPADYLEAGKARSEDIKNYLQQLPPDMRDAAIQLYTYILEEEGPDEDNPFLLAIEAAFLDKICADHETDDLEVLPDNPFDGDMFWTGPFIYSYNGKEWVCRLPEPPSIPLMRLFSWPTT